MRGWNILGLTDFDWQAQKVRHVPEPEDDELEEESLLETPLEKLEPYGLFRDALLRMLCRDPPLKSYALTAFAGLQQEEPHLYDSLTKTLNPDEQNVIQGVIHQAEANALSAAQAQVNGVGH